MTKVSLENALRAARDFIIMSDNSNGCCMCGSPCDTHGMGDGHSPVDEGDYHARMIVEQIDETLNEPVSNPTSLGTPLGGSSSD